MIPWLSQEARWTSYTPTTYPRRVFYVHAPHRAVVSVDAGAMLCDAAGVVALLCLLRLLHSTSAFCRSSFRDVNAEHCAGGASL